MAREVDRELSKFDEVNGAGGKPVQIQVLAACAEMNLSTAGRGRRACEQTCAY